MRLYELLEGCTGAEGTTAAGGPSAALCYPFAPETWVCPECANEQNSNFEWCGKNLKCQRCGTYSYYNEWVVKG